MPTALLYHRTISTLSDTVGATTPELLLANHASQVLEFDFPENILEGVKFAYENNMSDIPAPNSDGVKKINKQENGLRSIKLTINGVFKNAIPSTLNADIAKLKNMAKLSQTDLKHVFGIIGFYSPNAAEFSLDPDATTGALPAGKATIGYTLESFNLGYVGQQRTRYDFQVTLSFGGTFTG